MPIKNIIFDLGGVLYKIDYKIVTDKLQSLSPNLYFSQLQQHPIFDDFETGKISAHDFRQAIRDLTQHPNLQDSDIDSIWNSMLLGLYEHSLPLIKKLSVQYPIALLSNANIIHYEHILEECRELFNAMQKVFFSFQIGKRKPHREAFEHVLKEMNFSPQETLFVDDTILHIEGAKSVGLQTLHLTNPLQIEQAINSYLS